MIRIFFLLPNSLKMNNITNVKIQNLFPTWASFRGFSLLFHNQGNSLREIEKDSEILLLRNDLSDPSHVFYRKIHGLLQTLLPQLPMNDYEFCPLPHESYHATCWDGANKGNMRDFHPEARQEFRPLVQGFPNSLSQLPQRMETILNSELAARPDWDIEFRLNKLSVWGDNVVVARLIPADEESKLRLDELEQHWKDLNRSFQEENGYSRDFRNSFEGHVSLGYFINPLAARRFKALGMEATWTSLFLEKLRDEDGNPETIRYKNAGLYGFTDMEHFYTTRKYMKLATPIVWAGPDPSIEYMQNLIKLLNKAKQELERTIVTIKNAVIDVYFQKPLQHPLPDFPLLDIRDYGDANAVEGYQSGKMAFCWYENVRRAFEDPAVSSVLYYPVDANFEHSKHNTVADPEKIKEFSLLLNGDETGELFIMGDYTCVEVGKDERPASSMKDDVEKEIRSTVQAKFPKLPSNMKRVRSEFWGIGRKLFTQFMEFYKGEYAQEEVKDPSLLILLYCLKYKKKVKSYDLGQYRIEPFDESKKVAQLKRAQLLINNFPA